MATEPISATGVSLILTGMVGTALGPIYGPAVLMIFAAIIGGMIALGSTKTESKWESFRFMVIAVGLSLTLTGIAIWWLERYTPIPGNIALMPVSCIFAMTRNRILWLIDKLLAYGVSKLTGREETL